MSKIGNQPITIPADYKVTITPGKTVVVSPKAELSILHTTFIQVKQEGDQLIISRSSESKPVKAEHGAIRAQIQNMVTGLTTPWSKTMEIRGTGYKFTLAGDKLTILAGFIHPVIFTAPTGITFSVADESKLTITGANKILVGQIASNVRKVRKPEPYKGKGIRYIDEFIKLKPGKAAAKTA